MELDKIAASIRSARVKAGLTQKEVAVALNKGQTTVASWETGRSQPDAITIIALSELFHVSSDYLLGISNFQDQNSEKFLNALIGDQVSELSNWSKDKLSQFTSDLLKFCTAVKEIDIELLPLAIDTLISLLHTLQDLIDDYSKYEKMYSIYHASSNLVDHFNSLSDEEQHKLLSTYNDFDEILKECSSLNESMKSFYPHEFAGAALDKIEKAENSIAQFALFLTSSLPADDEGQSELKSNIPEK